VVAHHWRSPVRGRGMGHLWGALCGTYEIFGIDRAVGGDEVLRDLVRRRIIEPSSKRDALLAETGVATASTEPSTAICQACMRYCQNLIHRS
jgi:hypothetical protein